MELRKNLLQTGDSVSALIHVGCFYFTLGNLHPKYRSTLKSIQLLALVKNDHIQKYGMDSVLQHITADVAKLEEVQLHTCTCILATFPGSPHAKLAILPFFCLCAYMYNVSQVCTLHFVT